MTTIAWCKKKSKGIRLIAPNENLSKEYLQTAKETLDVLKTIKGRSKVWLATTKYYCEYFAIYSLLMRIGIKCEIHECTIAICRLLEEMMIIPSGFTEKLDEDKTLRVDNQYYLKNKDVPINYDALLEFILKTQDVADKLTKQDIEKIRKMLK